MENKKVFLEIDTYINQMAESNIINSFYPQMISRKLNIPLEVVLVELMKCVENGKLILKYEVKCLDDANTIVVIDTEKETILDEIVECKICGEEIEVSYAHMYPKFFISDEFKDVIKKKKLRE